MRPIDSSAAIGIFDSGSGGLTVLGAVRKRLANRRFVYLGDHAHAPYGPRSPEDVTRLTRDGVAAMFDRGCSLVVVACNTASAIALRPLQEEWLDRRYPDRRLLGVFIPIIEALTGRSWDRNDDFADPQPCFDLAVFATPATVRAQAFGNEVRRRLPNVRIWEQGCPDLVDLIEAGADKPAIAAAVARSVAELRARSTTLPRRVLLGCTHYPLVRDAFAWALPPGTEIIDQPEIVADSLARYLDRRSVMPRPGGCCGGGFEDELLTTGSPTKVGAVASRLSLANGEVQAALSDGGGWRTI